MTKILLLRHAQVERSKEVLNSQWPLTLQGKQSAIELVDFLKSFKIDCIYSSPYRRTIETVEPIAESLSLHINIDVGLKGRKMPKSVSLNPWTFFEDSWNNNQYKIFDSESGEECANRAINTLTHIGSLNKNKCILVCSHSNLIGYFLKSIDNTLPFSWFKNMKCPALFDIDFDGDNFSWNKNIEFSNGIAGH